MSARGMAVTASATATATATVTVGASAPAVTGRENIATDACDLYNRFKDLEDIMELLALAAEGASDRTDPEALARGINSVLQVWGEVSVPVRRVLNERCR